MERGTKGRGVGGGRREEDENKMRSVTGVGRHTIKGITKTNPGHTHNREKGNAMECV